MQCEECERKDAVIQQLGNEVAELWQRIHAMRKEHSEEIRSLEQDARAAVAEARWEERSERGF